MAEFSTTTGWSARQLAERCADLGGAVLNRPTIANIEAGRRGYVSVEELLTLAKALDVTPLDLLIPSGETPEEVAAAALARARMAGFPAPWDEVRESLFHLSLAAAFSPAASKTIRSMIEKDWFPEKEAVSINQVMRSSWEMQMRGRPSEPPEEAE